MTVSLPSPVSPSGTAPLRQPDTLREASEKLEATFLAEMLKSAGLGTQTHGFDGGIGEEQFASFKREALAMEMVRRGGIGLADIFEAALKEKIDE